MKLPSPQPVLPTPRAQGHPFFLEALRQLPRYDSAWYHLSKHNTVLSRCKEHWPEQSISSRESRDVNPEL